MSPTAATIPSPSFNLPTNAPVPPSIAVGNTPTNASIRGDQSSAYVANVDSNTVSVVNTATNAVVTTVNVGPGPLFAAITPNGANVYLSNNGTNTVSVISTATNAVGATITVEAAPAGIGVTPGWNARLRGELQRQHGLGYQHGHQSGDRRADSGEEQSNGSGGQSRWDACLCREH